MRSIAKGSALLATIGITFALAPPSFAQTAVEGGYKDENGNMHWGESRPEPQAHSSRSSSGSSASSSNREGAYTAQRLTNSSTQAMGRNDYESAVRYAEEAFRIHPSPSTQGNVYLRRADLAASKGDYKSTFYYYEQAGRANPQFKTFFENSPAFLRYKAAYARQQQSQKQTHSTTPTRTTTSVRQTARPEKDQPNRVAGVTPKEEAELRMQLALALAKKGDQKGSVKALNEALKLDPNSPRQKEVYAAWKQSSGGGTSNHAPANQSTSARAPADQLDADKAGSELHDIKGPHFVKSQQLPPPPILKGEPPNAAVRHELDNYLKKWKERNQEYQKAAPKEAAQLKKDMERDNNKFKEKMRKSYGVDL